MRGDSTSEGGHHQLAKTKLNMSETAKTLGPIHTLVHA